MDIFPNWTVVPIVLFLVVLTYILNRTFFRPMGQTLAERSRLACTARIEEFEKKLREARRESDSHMAQIRSGALEEKNRVLSETRGRAEKTLSDAREDIRSKTAQAEKQLHDHAEDFARRIASRILNRPLRQSRQMDLQV
jgi:F0F1-type ATP synthase membrane subunit b/b'